MITFSAAVNELMRRFPACRSAELTAQTLNSAIRAFEKFILPPEMMLEEQVPTTMTGAALWHIPDLRKFCAIGHAEDSSCAPGKKVTPSTALTALRAAGKPYYYQSGSSIVFGLFRDYARFSWYAHSPVFKYYADCDAPIYERDEVLVARTSQGERRLTAQDAARLVTSQTLLRYMDDVLLYASMMLAGESDDPQRAHWTSLWETRWRALVANNVGMA